MEDLSDEAPEDVPDLSPLLHRIVIDHPDEFVRELTGVTAPWVKKFGPIRPWFRGMPRLSFSLEPSLLRYRAKGLNLNVVANNLSRQFQNYGARLLDEFPAANDLELLTVMQHHGIPTRLLDWTENAFAALYFAVRQFEHLNDPEDAIVWMLEPLQLAKIKGCDGIPFSDPQLAGYGNLPLPFYPVHRSPRVTPQRGTFTVHPLAPQHALMKLALKEVRDGGLSPLVGIRIRGNRRAFIRGALVGAFGQGEFTFFPDLDGLARELRIREGLEGKG